MKKCNKCEIEKDLSEFGKNKRTKDGLAYYCKRCINKGQREYGKTEKGKLVYRRNNQKDWISPNEMYSRAKAYCNQKKRVFTLTRERYIELYNLPCYYCGNILCGNKIKKGVSLDRIDNTRGYELDNVLPCGSFCNRTKGDRLTVEEMLAVAKFIMTLRNVNA